MSQYPVISVSAHQELTTQSIIFTDMDTLLAGQLTQSSINMYKRDVKAYQTFADEQRKHPLDVQTFIAWRESLTLDSAKSPHTINRMLSAVKRTLKEASIKHQIDEALFMRFNNQPGVKVKALKKRLKENARTRISKADMRRLCESPDAATFIGMRDRALLATLASSGGRASEIASLTPEQIRRQDNGYIISVMGKTDTEPRDAHLNNEAYALIQEWIETRDAFVAEHHLEQSPYLFTTVKGRGDRYAPTHITESGIWLVVQKYAKLCGLAHIKPHDFRRYVGTQLAKRDIRKAQKALGHASIEVTARHYVLDDLEAGETNDIY